MSDCGALRVKFPPSEVPRLLFPGRVSRRVVVGVNALPLGRRVLAGNPKPWELDDFVAEAVQATRMGATGGLAYAAW